MRRATVLAALALGLLIGGVWIAGYRPSPSPSPPGVAPVDAAPLAPPLPSPAPAVGVGLPKLPPVPSERWSGSLPEFVYLRDLEVSSAFRQERRLAFASPGAETAYRALDPSSLPADERLEAQRAMVREAVAQKRTNADAYRPLRDLRAAVDDYQKVVWASGSRQLARWLLERSVDLEGAVSDGPPAAEVTRHLACPLGEAGRACAELGYPDCAAAERVRTQAEALCASP